jgi:hypothetical protein
MIWSADLLMRRAHRRRDFLLLVGMHALQHWVNSVWGMCILLAWLG